MSQKKYNLADNQDFLAYNITNNNTKKISTDEDCHGELSSIKSSRR